MSLTSETFTFVANHVRTKAAIQLEAGKEYLVEARLRPLAQAAGHASVDSYVRAARDRALPQGLDDIVEALTTNETSWFRDAAPFEALTKTVLPTLREERGHLRNLKVWSAACSTGQEPYSIVIALQDVLPASALSVLGTDLSEQVLTRARAGRYNQLEINRGLPATQLVKHFERDGADWKVSPAIQQPVRFARHNLLDTPALGGPFDVVFLRNVLIYFDIPTKKAVLSRIRQVLAPDGFLFLGAAETTVGIDDSWERVPAGRTSIYRPVTPTRPSFAFGRPQGATP